MKSIRTKILSVVFISVVITALMLLIISIVSISIINDRDSDQLLEHIGIERATSLNMRLEAIEHSVDSIYYYAIDRLEGDPNKLYDETFRSEYIRKIEELALSEAENTKNVKVVYFRLATDITEPPYGFIYQSDDMTDRFTETQLTDILKYDASDVEHVGWYYIPMEAKKAIWMDPYQNKNLGIKMISYVSPIYVGDRFIGIVGMDVDINVINVELSQIKTYDTGSAVLFDGNSNIVYSHEHTMGLNTDDFDADDSSIARAMNTAVKTAKTVRYNISDGEYKMYASGLNSNMTLCITAPISEINQTQQSVLMFSVLLSIVILAITTAMTFAIVKNFLKPLSELTKASEQLANGNLDIKLDYKEGDEIGTLAKTYETMAVSLKHYFDHFHSLAYTDELTGLNNKAAFNMTKDVIESEIKMGRADFSLIVMDVNNLKVINDTLGHEMGDMLLKHVVTCMRRTFVGYPLYRIGGDEFAAIINHAEPKGLVETLQRITADESKKDMATFNCSYQIAAGSAQFDRTTDHTFSDVFDRADRAMYDNKKMLKGEIGV